MQRVLSYTWLIWLNYELLIASAITRIQRATQFPEPHLNLESFHIDSPFHSFIHSAYRRCDSVFIGGISGTVGRLLIYAKCLSACSSRTHALGVVHAQHAECVITKECLMNVVLGHNMFWTIILNYITLVSIWLFLQCFSINTSNFVFQALTCKIRWVLSHFCLLFLSWEFVNVWKTSRSSTNLEPPLSFYPTASYEGESGDPPKNYRLFQK